MDRMRTPIWPNNGGSIVVVGDSSQLTVSFVDVPEFSSTGANNFAVTLRADGSVTIVYGSVTANDGLVGVTPGGGADNSGPTYLSSGSTYPVLGTTYYLFTGGDPFDLDGASLYFGL